MGIEAAQALDGVAEELDAYGAVGFGGINVEDAAANGVLAFHLDGFALFVTDALEVSGEIVHGDLLALPQGEGQLPVGFGALGAEQGAGRRE